MPCTHKTHSASAHTALTMLTEHMAASAQRAFICSTMNAKPVRDCACTQASSKIGGGSSELELPPSSASREVYCAWSSALRICAICDGCKAASLKNSEASNPDSALLEELLGELLEEIS
jgi:hypothetical protein